MRKTFFLAFSLLTAISFNISATSRFLPATEDEESTEVDSLAAAASENAYADSIVALYTDSLNALLQVEPKKSGKRQMPSPYFFRLFGPGTLYNSVLTQSMTDTQAPASEATFSSVRLPSLGSSIDRQLQLDYGINHVLGRAYVESPQLFATTQEQLMSGTKLRSDLSKKVQEEVKLAEKAAEAAPDVKVEAVQAVAAKPNFWTIKGNGGLQFTQNYFSKNWFQGGEKNYSMLGMLTLDANYDNKQRVQWDNKLEAQLGFQTTESSEPKFRPTSNLLRLTSKLGIKAVGHWNYAAQLQLQSQPYISYNGSSKDIVGDFLSPLYVRSSIGMDYKIKKKRFEGSLYLSPLSYVITYVKRDKLVRRYGINNIEYTDVNFDPEAGRWTVGGGGDRGWVENNLNTYGSIKDPLSKVKEHNSKHEWGPNINFTFTYKIWKNISWTSRSYYFSNFHLIRFECENRFNFIVNKYISAQFFFYPRYEDPKKYNVHRGEDGFLTEDSARDTYWMFKEFLSLGLSYDF